MSGPPDASCKRSLLIGKWCVDITAWKKIRMRWINGAWRSIETRQVDTRQDETTRRSNRTKRDVSQDPEAQSPREITGFCLAAEAEHHLHTPWSELRVRAMRKNLMYLIDIIWRYIDRRWITEIGMTWRIAEPRRASMAWRAIDLSTWRNIAK